MKKIILTIAALVVAAVMVFAFSGCNSKTTETESTTDAAASITLEDTTATVVPEVAESSTLA